MSFTPSVAMAATASASSTGPRYAPHDPTLPKPWRVLVCGNTGNLYFWNPVTNVTQYEMPVTSSPAAPLSMSKSATKSFVQIQQLSGSSEQVQKNYNPYDNGSNCYNGVSNMEPKHGVIPSSQNHQSNHMIELAPTSIKCGAFLC